jgi:D-serine dehydratase
MHFINKEDNKFGLKTYLKEKDYNFFVKCPYSPLIFLRVETGIEFMK